MSYETVVLNERMEVVERIEGCRKKPIDLYYKLHKCLKIAIGNEALGCHVNNIIVHLGKSIESQETWYDESVDGWCDYFLSMNQTAQ